MKELLCAVITLSGLGLIFGLGLALATKFFSVKTDPRIEKVELVLPGANCGACGKAGCLGFAEAIIGEKDTENLFCPPGGEEVANKIACILGREATTKEKEKLTVLCCGGNKAKDKYEYAGIKDCWAAKAYFDGQKVCKYACLGFGSCVKACPFGALSMGSEGLPVIDRERCTNCAKCVAACPKRLITTRPLRSHFWVACSSKDKGAAVMKACKQGCIGCGKCVKACEFSAIKIVDNLAVIDYTKCTNCRKCIEVCPTKVIKTDYNI